ncbi:MAG: hypothetical protein ACPL7I_11280, partial [Myxococcota bacterium]
MKKVLVLATVFLLTPIILLSDEVLKKEKQISEEYYDLLFDKNKVGKVRLESYTSKYKGMDVYVIEEEMNAVFLRGGTEMRTYSKSRTLSNIKDLSPIGYWYETSEGNVKRTIMGLVSKDRRHIDISMDIGGIKTEKRLEIPRDAIFSNAFEFYIRRYLTNGFSKKLPLIME